MTKWGFIPEIWPNICQNECSKFKVNEPPKFSIFKKCLISSDTEEFDENLTAILHKIFQQSEKRRVLSHPDKLGHL